MDEQLMVDCYKCEGKGGHIYWKPSANTKNFGWTRCPICRGHKKLDWIENAMGGRRKINRPINSHNVFVGHQAGMNLSTGQNNIAIGFKAGIAAYNPIKIGSKAKV